MRAALLADLLSPSRSDRTIVGVDASKHHHNRDFKTFHEFRRAVIDFLRYEAPRRWGRFRDRITDNFRVIRRQDFRVIV